MINRQFVNKNRFETEPDQDTKDTKRDISNKSTIKSNNKSA